MKLTFHDCVAHWGTGRSGGGGGGKSVAAVTVAMSQVLQVGEGGFIYR